MSGPGAPSVPAGPGQGERLVVVGAGMAASRLVEGLVAGGYRGSVTVVGDEEHAPYNRILLSAVLEGSHRADALTLRDPAWFVRHGVDLRLGVRVAELDREAGEAVLVDGARLPWDRLVLATGAIPTLPPIRGLVRVDGRLHESVHAFRSLDDCRRMLAALGARRPGRAVIVGGGLLGLQVARALAVRGVATEVVEGTSHLLSGQLGEAAGAVLRRDLARLGTEVYTGVRAVRLTDAGLRLDNGVDLPADLVVLTAGGRPSTALARRAGLMVRRGVVVDGRLRSVSDERIHAIGDCAEHRGRTTGFVAPAWEQAGVLARVLTGHLSGAEPAYDGHRTVARLRAAGLEVAVLGDPERARGEVVEMTNPVQGTYRKLVVDAGVIEAATLVGDLSSVGLVTQLFDRRTVLGPAEPGALLMPQAPSAPGSLPDDVEVCACAGVSAGAVRACGDLAQVRSRTRATTGCGGCEGVVRTLLAEAAPVG
ncbi:FAD-dependent oxidoreductase [Nocardioides campestrisoli]|uniref:FAD-dependent oxidoreductase n=1 Tax=Nocardioides campestrisoli TaxID=2736757 RepID=UPI001CD2EA5B|nr:FAD-dependent oxidoreductase [Nocardioides campestrisoli]